MLKEWLAEPLDDITSNVDRDALAAVVAGQEDPKLITKALARLVEKRRHLVWRAAPGFPYALRMTLGDVCKKSRTVEARFYAKLAPRGLFVLRGIHQARSNGDLARAINLAEAKEPAVIKAAVAVCSDRSFAKCLKDSFETDEQGAVGLIGVAMYADKLLLDDKRATKRLVQLTAMASELGAKKVLVRLKQLGGVDSEASGWAKRLGLGADGLDWEIGIALAAREQTGTYAPAFKIAVGGSPGEDWCLTSVHSEHGVSTCFAGKILADPAKLGRVKSLTDTSIWIKKTEKIYGVEWLLDKPKITGAPAAWKPKIAAWVRSLRR
jgi:hypothetical protein